MEKPKIAQTSPYCITLEAGKNYAWCSCGMSQNQPFCDGAHSGSGMSPNIFKVKETKDYYLCGCKQTKEDPFCDGSHSKLG